MLEDWDSSYFHLSIASCRENVSLDSWARITHGFSENRILEGLDTKESLIKSLIQILSNMFKSALYQLIHVHSDVQPILETLLGWNKRCKLTSASQELQSQLVQTQASGVLVCQYKTILIRLLKTWELKTAVFQSAASFSSNRLNIKSAWRDMTWVKKEDKI